MYNMSRKEGNIERKVANDLSEAGKLAKATHIEDIKSGKWFLALLAKVAETYDRNARAEYFQKKYPGLSPDEITDILINVTVKYATIAGGIAGAAVTVDQVAALGSAGATIALMAGAIGAEMIYLARIQMRLILDISVLYDLQLDTNDPEDILMIFGFALGVLPADFVGKGFQKAAAAGTQYAIRKYIRKGTLKSIQEFAGRIGIKVLQRSIIKYTVPVVSAAIGSSYNYFTTKTVGRVAKTHFKNRGKVTEELRSLISRRNKYHIVFPAAVLYMAYVDGKFHIKEKELYKAVLSRLNLEDYEQEDFQKLLSDREHLLNTISEIEEKSIRENLIKVMALMAVYDGELTPEEQELIKTVADRIDIKIDIKELKRQTEDYRIIAKENIFHKTSGIIKDTGASIGNSISNAYKKVSGRKKLKRK